MAAKTEDKKTTQTQSLNYILLHLAKLKKEYASLQATYSFSIDTHFLLLKPANLFKNKKFVAAIGQIILDFYRVFPDEGIGIRLEDNILITREGNENIMKNIPIEIDEIETLIHENQSS